jgi:nanoRNase/pAp phosphatase (c-di-AMP/oligoRNAs hydrolase)
LPERSQPELASSADGSPVPPAGDAAPANGSPQAGAASLEPRLDELLSVVDPAREVGIFSHDNPDPDAIASAFCLQQLLTEKLKAKCVLGFGGVVGRHENQAMVRNLGLSLVASRMLDFKRFGTIALVDSQPGTGNNSLPEGTSIDIVIDHHPLRKESQRARFVDVRPDYGSTSTILFRYLQAAGVTLPNKVATAIMLGIKSDTRELERQASEEDMKAYLQILPQADLQLLARIENPPISRRYFQSFWDALSRSRVYGDAVVSILGEVEHPDMVAEIADFLIPLEEVRFALSVGSDGEKLFVSLRTQQQQHDAGQMLRQVLKGLGRAGGHGRMAGGQVELKEGSPTRIELEEKILERFLETARIDDAAGAPLVTGPPPGVPLDVAPG